MSRTSKITSAIVGVITVLLMTFGLVAPATAAGPVKTASPVYVPDTNPPSPLSTISFTGQISLGCTNGAPVVTFNGYLGASESSSFNAFTVSGSVNGSGVGSSESFQAPLATRSYTKTIVAPATTSDTIFLVVTAPNPGWYVLAKVQTFPCASLNVPKKVVAYVYNGGTLFLDSFYAA
ncbi:MAG: hypothetical protein WAQ27_05855 [Candidatus Microsaccharimonas sp.]